MDNEILRECVIPLSNLCGNKVADYVKRSNVELDDEYSWVSFEDLPISTKAKKRLCETVGSLQIVLNNKDNEIIWCGSKSREYSIKMGYQILYAESWNETWPKMLC